MTRSLEPFGALARRLDAGARLLRAWPLSGGVSARVTALEVVWSGGQAGRLVVREYGGANVRRDPEAADTEFRLLRALQAAGLPVPRPRLVDTSRVLFSAPVLVTDFVEGAVDLSPADPAAVAALLADFLARLHALSLAGLPPLPPPPGLGARPDEPEAARLWAGLSAPLCSCMAISGPATCCGIPIGSPPCWTGRTRRMAILWPTWATRGWRSFSFLGPGRWRL